MASTEGASNETVRAGGTSRGSGEATAAGAVETRDLAKKTRAAVNRTGAGQRMRDVLDTPAGAGVLASAAAQLDPAAPAQTASLAPAAGTLAPVGLAHATEALAARAGIAAAGAVGGAAGAVALVVLPTNTAPPHVVEITPDLRVWFSYDLPVGTIAVRVDGRWRDTGIQVTMTPEGMGADVAALEARIGPLDELHEARSSTSAGTGWASPRWMP